MMLIDNQNIVHEVAEDDEDERNNKETSKKPSVVSSSVNENRDPDFNRNISIGNIDVSSFK